MPHDSLTALLEPRAVAVIGASSDPTRIGGRPIAYLKASGFDGAIYPVNPRSTEIQGLPAFASIADVPGPVDLAICAVPAALAEGVVKDAVASGVKAMVMFSAGFAELGADGAERQRHMADLARAGGMRLVGPNCMGVANLRTGMLASFHQAFQPPLPRDGKIGLVSQSGAFGGLSTWLALERGVALSHVITTGNEADVQVADGLAYLAAADDVAVILLYMEGVRDGPRFVAGLRLAHERRKPVIAIKLGRTAVGAEAAASHTAAMAGVDAVYDALFRQYGVYRATSIEEFLDLGCAAAVGGLPPNDRLGLVTVSGGVGVLMADDATDRGLDVAELPASTQAAIKALVPFAGTRNPIDITGQIANDRELLDKAMDHVLTDGGYGAVIGFQGATFTLGDAMTRLVPAWSAMKKRYPDRWLATSGLMSREAQQALEKAGIPSFREPTHATRAAGALAAIRRAHERPLEQVELPILPPPPEGPLDECEAMAVLRGAGIDTVAVERAATADAAVAAAERLGFPVALKVLSPDIVHKSDVGGVRLGLGDAEAVREAFATVQVNARAAAPSATLRGVLVSPMCAGGVETIIGVTRDPVFGPLVMFGLGGVFVEVLSEVSFRIAPFGVAEAQRMIGETRGAGVLAGVRGAPAADVEALAAALSRLSVYAALHADRIVSIEANPFLVRPAGEGALALDAVVMVETSDAHRQRET